MMRAMQAQTILAPQVGKLHSSSLQWVLRRIVCLQVLKKNVETNSMCKIREENHTWASRSQPQSKWRALLPALPESSMWLCCPQPQQHTCSASCPVCSSCIWMKAKEKKAQNENLWRRGLCHPTMLYLVRTALHCLRNQAPCLQVHKQAVEQETQSHKGMSQNKPSPPSPPREDKVFNISLEGANLAVLTPPLFLEKAENLEWCIFNVKPKMGYNQTLVTH